MTFEEWWENNSRDMILEAAIASEMVGGKVDVTKVKITVEK